MRTFTAIALVTSFVLIAIWTTIEGALTILFGWIPFLGRVLPEAEPDWPSVLVSAIALFLFGAGVHWLGRSWYGRRHATGSWRIRWTVAVLLGVVLLFAAGISVIGMTHQVAWLATSDEPIFGQGLQRRGNAETQLRMIGLGLGNYESTYNVFPPSGTFSSSGEMGHSWETHLLPYMGYSTQGIDMKRPWNAPENQPYFQSVLPSFINPGFRTPPLTDNDGFGLSHYAANSRVLSANKSLALIDITNGASNTIVVGEVNTGFKPWGHPINSRDPAIGLNGGAKTFGGPSSNNGTMFLMADGSVRIISNKVDPAVLRDLSKPRPDR